MQFRRQPHSTRLGTRRFLPNAHSEILDFIAKLWMRLHEGLDLLVKPLPETHGYDIEVRIEACIAKILALRNRVDEAWERRRALARALAQAPESGSSQPPPDTPQTNPSG